MTAATSTAPRVHVIVQLSHSAQRAEACLYGLMAQTLAPWRVTIFDNASMSDVGELVARDFPQFKLLRSPARLGLAAGHNRAAAAGRDADFILLLDPEAVLAVNALAELMDVFSRHPGLGVLGCKLLDRDVETIRSIGLELTENGLIESLGRGEPDRGQYRGLREAPGVSPAAMCARAEVWAELGGLDEAFEPAMYEGVDFCFRARAAGWRVAVACDATATHFNPWSLRRGDPEGLGMFFRGRARFLRKHFSRRDWLGRFLPGELRWLRDFDSQGMRAVALRSLAQVVCGGRARGGRPA